MNRHKRGGHRSLVTGHRLLSSLRFLRPLRLILQLVRQIPEEQLIQIPGLRRWDQRNADYDKRHLHSAEREWRRELLVPQYQSTQKQFLFSREREPGLGKKPCAPEPGVTYARKSATAIPRRIP